MSTQVTKHYSKPHTRNVLSSFYFLNQTSNKKDDNTIGETNIQREENQQSGKQVIKLSAKIRNVNTNHLGEKYNRSNMFISTCNSSYEGNRLFESPLQKTDLSVSRNFNLQFKRIDSSAFKSSLFNSPQLCESSILTTSSRITVNKPLARDSDRTIQSQSMKTTMQSFLVEDRERLQKLVQEKSLQIVALNRNIFEDRKSFQSKTRQKQNEIYQLRRELQHANFQFNIQIQSIKKQNEIKDTLIGQLNNDLRELKNIQVDNINQISNLNRLHKREIDEWKRKVNQIQIELKHSFYKLQSLKSQKSHQNSTIIKTSSICFPSQLSPKANKLSLSLIGSSILDRTKNDELQSKKKVIQQQNKMIKMLNNELEQKQQTIEILNRTIYDTNEQMIKERISMINDKHKNWY